MGIEFARQPRDPVISVVIPSIPRYDHEPVIACLDNQSLDAPYEVLVVNDETLNRADARNCGLRNAGSEIVAFTDDDTKPPGDWLEAIVREFRADPALVCLEGSVFGGCRNRGPRHYVGCNLAVRREAALAVGGFRSEFSEWREDVEFGWRMEAQSDGECRYRETVRMCHPTVPRTAYKPELERRLREEYPERYEEVMNATVWQRVKRYCRACGVSQPFERAVNMIRRRMLRDPAVQRATMKQQEP